jgi:guanylate kinase
MGSSILVVSGPSGGGKTSLCKAMCKQNDIFYFSVSTTTRPKRVDEVEGVDYHFVTKEQFLKDIEQNNFIEWAEVHGNFYGTSKIQINEELAKDKTVIVDIDVQGHMNIRKIFPTITTSVFVTTNSLSTLRQRLTKRGTDSNEVIEQRIINAFDEMKYMKEYDYIIINEDFNDSLDKLTCIAKSSRFTSNKLNLDEFLKKWKI